MAKYRDLTDEILEGGCDDCRGPFEFWGFSSDYRLLRCLNCRVVKFFERKSELNVGTWPEEPHTARSGQEAASSSTATGAAA
jgi:hypothetical protein